MRALEFKATKFNFVYKNVYQEVHILLVSINLTTLLLLL